MSAAESVVICYVDSESWASEQRPNNSPVPFSFPCSAGFQGLLSLLSASAQHCGLVFAIPPSAGWEPADPHSSGPGPSHLACPPALRPEVRLGSFPSLLQPAEVHAFHQRLEACGSVGWTGLRARPPQPLASGPTSDNLLSSLGD